MQGPRQFAAVELWIVARTRHGAHIHQPLHLMRLKKLNKLLCRTGGVPDGHDQDRC